MQFERRHLRVLTAISEAGSMHKAAQRLQMTQPAVSRLLADIERELGARVFDRTASGSTPTARGAELVAHAQTVLQGLERMDAVARGRSAVVRLGCIPRAMHTLMPVLIRQLGGLDCLRVTEEGSIRLQELLERGRLEFAVLRHVAGSAGLGERFRAERLYDERPVVICRPRHPLARAGVLRLEDLGSCGWVLPSAESTTRGVLDRFWQEIGLAPIRPVIETRSFESSVALAAGTELLSIIPDSIAAIYARARLVHVLPVIPALPTTEVLLAGERHALADSVLDGFRRQVIAAAALMPAADQAHGGTQR